MTPVVAPGNLGEILRLRNYGTAIAKPTNAASTFIRSPAQYLRSAGSKFLGPSIWCVRSATPECRRERRNQHRSGARPVERNVHLTSQNVLAPPAALTHGK